MSDLTNLFTSIANAIRNKKETTEKINATEFATEIENLPSQEINNQDKVITLNGVYNADTGYTGLGKVTVNVPSSSGEDEFLNFRTNNGTSFQGLFAYWTYKSSHDTSEEIDVTIDNLDASNVTSMKYMFANNSLIKSIMFSNFNTSNVESMESMFQYCPLVSINFGESFDTSKVTSFKYMFTKAKFTSLNLSEFITSNVKDLTSMFAHCSNIENIDLTNWDTSNVTIIASFFYNCPKLVEIKGEINLIKVITISSCFYNCKNLVEVRLLNLNTSYLDLTDCVSLSHESLTYLLNNAVQQKSSKTLKLGDINLDKLTDEEIAIGTSKGFTIS